MPAVKDRNAYYRAWRTANREKCRAASRRHYERNREAILETQRVAREADPEPSREASRSWREHNPDKVQSGWGAWRERHPERVAAWRSENTDLIRAGIRAWQKAHPEKMAEYRTRRRARKRGAGGSHTAAQWELLLEASNRVCLACGRDADEVELTRDHVVPLSKGGDDNISNIQPLCRSCNAAKGTKYIDFRAGGDDPCQQ